MSEILLFPRLQQTVDEWCVAQGGGFSGCLVMAVELIDEDGARSVVIAASPDSSNHVKVGLAHMLTERFGIESRIQLMSAFYEDDDEDDEDE